MLVKEIFKSYEKLDGKELELEGWIKQTRFNNHIGFIALNDGTCFANIQLVVSEDNDDFKEISKYGIYSSIKVLGTLVLTPNQKQPFELQVKKISLLGGCDEDYPIQNKRHTLEYLRTVPSLRMRANIYNAVFRVRSEIAFAIHKFFNDRGYVYVHTPIITNSDAEGAGQMFQVTTLDIDNPSRDEDGGIDYSEDFFGTKANLTVSGQLEVEPFAMTYRNVYTFGPTFRAENSNTPRHAAEFWMVEPELAYADLSDVMDCEEEMVKFIIKYVMDKLPAEFDFFNKFVDKGLIDRLDNVMNSKFKRLSYTEAVDILIKSGQKFEYKVKWGDDLQTEHERYLTEKVFNGPVFITDYPKDIKAFYMRLNDDKKTVAAVDLLVPGVGELIGGSQREERSDILLSMMKEKGMNIEEYQWYLDLRRFGGNKHGGFGLGFERMVMYLTGVSNIRDVLPYPRTVNSMHK